MRPPYTGEETINFRELSVNVENIKLSVLTDKGLFDEMRVEGPGQSEMHVHAYYEAFLVKEGRMSIKTTDATLDMYENDFAIIMPGVYHYTVMQEKSTKRYSLGFTYKKNCAEKAEDLYSDFDRVIREGTVKKQEIRPNRAVCVHSANIRSTLDRLYGYYTSGSALKWQYVKACINELVLLIYEDLSRKDSVPNIAEILGDNSLARSYKIEAIVNKYYMYDISAAFIAEKLFLSEKQVNRIVKKLYNQTFGQKITALRMKVASQYLAETAMTVSEIAGRVGYTSLCGFYSAFEKCCGCTPGEFRGKMAAIKL